MKKLLFFLTAFFVFTNSFAAFEIKPVAKKADQIFLPIGKDMKISLMDLSVIKVSDFEKLTGKHLGFIDKIFFKTSQKKLRTTINSDGTVDSKRLIKFVNEDGSGFNVGGFALGFLLGIIGVGIAYIINNDNNQSRRKWAWIGFGVQAVLGIITLLAR